MKKISHNFIPSRKKFEENLLEQNPVWIVTLSDLLALMTTFFIMLYSMSIVDMKKWENVSSSFSRSMQIPTQTQLDNPFEGIYIEKASLPQGTNLKYLMAIISDKVQTIPNIDNVLELNLLEDRLVISLKGNAAFMIGMAELTDQSQNLLGFLGQSLITVGNGIEVIGYADAEPIQTAVYPSDWELALNRAISVSNALRKSGYQYRINAFGKSINMEPNISAEEKGTFPQRVDIVVRSEKAVY